MATVAVEAQIPQEESAATPLNRMAVALLALIGVLATLQYRWLGRISEAERERMRTTLTHRAREFAADFDREVTRAFLLFQADPLHQDQDPVVRLAAQIERWQASSPYPRLLKEFYFVRRGADANNEGLELHRFDAQTQKMMRVAWPPAMRDWREQFAEKVESGGPGTVTIRRMSGPIWESVPAIVVPAPLLLVRDRVRLDDRRLASRSYTVLVIDLDYVRQEMLPALARRHFPNVQGGEPAGARLEMLRERDGLDSHVAVVSITPNSTIQYQSTPAFAPKHDTPADASADLFHVRTHDFNTIVGELRRATALSAIHVEEAARGTPGRSSSGRPPFSVLLQTPDAGRTERFTSTLTTRTSEPGAARWRLLLTHPAGSLDAAVNAARRRNLVVSMSILAVLGASMALLVLSTRRAQQLARQQMEFVAAVSHELRTPLAVIRSAGENLADGVVRDDDQIRQYGHLVRNEGRRLSEMVEEILELAGIQSGQRGMTLQPVAIVPLLHEIVSASSALIAAAGLTVEFDLPDTLPPVRGDAAALRRAVQNLVGNAIKYGKDGGTIVLRARVHGSHITVSVVDRGIGIAPAEQARIFHPFYRAADVVEAQIQGAGLGLSLVKRIVEAHGGSVTVKSAPGAGSEFTVTLPMAEGERAVS
jgi:signal transduction histidine kinase